MLRRLLPLCLAVMVSLALGACSATPAATSAPASASVAASTEAPTAAPTPAPAPTTAPVVTLQIFDLPSNTSGLLAGWWCDILAQQCGAKLEMMPAGDQGEQKLQALMASGELPDLVIFKDKKQVEDAVRANLLLCLDDHLDKLPNATLNAPTAMQYYRDSASAGTGKLYSIPTSVGPTGISGELNWSPNLRWDLYKKLGNPDIKTVDDYLTVLKQMQQLEPTNPDGQKVYGITLWKDWDNFQMMLGGELGCLVGIDAGDQLGASLPFLQVNFNNGDIMGTLDPASEYIHALKFYYQANQMGLLDPDSLTQRFDTALEKANQGRVLFGMWPWFIGGYNTPDKANVDNPKGFRPVLSDDYKALVNGDNKVGMPWSWSVGASTKYADVALKVIDFHYSTDGLLQLMNGPKGVTWDIGADGKPSFTTIGWSVIDDPTKELPGGGKLSDGMGVINANGMTSSVKDPTINDYIGGGLWDSSKSHNPTKLVQDWQSVTSYKIIGDMITEKKMFTTMPMSMRMVPAMPDDIQTICTQIGNVVKADSWKMVFAKDQTEFDSLLKDMTDKANGLGLDKVITWDKQAWQTAQDSIAKYN